MSLSLFDLTGRTALVTGSSQGIGYAMAGGLARAGARVVLNGRDAAKLDAAVAALRAEGLDVAGNAFDVSDPAAVETAVAEIERDRPDRILINNAGKQHRAPAAEFPDEAWHDILHDERRRRLLHGALGRPAHDHARCGQDRQHRLGAERTRPADHRRPTPRRRAP